MKTFSILLAILLFEALGCEDSGLLQQSQGSFCLEHPNAYYRYYFSERLSLIFRTDQIAIQLSTPLDSASFTQFLHEASPLLRSDSVECLSCPLVDTVHTIPWHILGVKLVPGLSVVQVESLLSLLQRFDNVHFASPGFFTDDAFRYKMYLTNEFYVVLRDSARFTTLLQLNHSFGLSTRRSGTATICYMTVPKTLCRNSLEVANYYMEQYPEILLGSEPNAVIEIRPGALSAVP
jgi:hypothetical protein